MDVLIHWTLFMLNFAIGFFFGFWKKNDKTIDRTFKKSLENKVKIVKPEIKLGAVKPITAQKQKEKGTIIEETKDAMRRFLNGYDEYKKQE